MDAITVDEMRDLERRCAEAGVGTEALMAQAGLAIAQETWMALGTLEERHILVLVGPGNNGGDGLVAARTLHEWGASVTAYLVAPRQNDDPVYRATVDASVPLVEPEADPELAALHSELGRSDAVIDAILGTGRGRAIEGRMADVLGALGEARSGSMAPRLVAVDLPTGLDADTGAVDPHTVAADITVALGYCKVGLFLSPGAEYVGQLQAVDIGMPSGVRPRAALTVLDRAWARAHLPPRPGDAHKGTFGRVLVVGGSRWYRGAPVLAAEAAYRVGAGLVTVCSPASIVDHLASRLREATWLPAADHDGVLAADAAREWYGREFEAACLGPGLADTGYTRALVRAACFGTRPPAGRGTVIDADALNALAAMRPWPAPFPAGSVLTPHPGEMSRLLDRPIRDIQADRLGAARSAAAAWDVVVVLKGAGTVIAAPDGWAALSPFANPLLATAGTGDVLSGAIAGLLAQGVEAPVAAALGVFLHGMAAERLAAEYGSGGLLAGELAAEIARAVRDLRK